MLDGNKREVQDCLVSLNHHIEHQTGPICREHTRYSAVHIVDRQDQVPGNNAGPGRWVIAVDASHPRVAPDLNAAAGNLP